MEPLWKGGAAVNNNKSAQELIIGEDKKYDKLLFKYEILSLISYHLSLDDNLLKPSIRNQIIEGLRDLYRDGIESLDEYEDIHSYVEGEFSKKFPDLAKYLRILLSRNEQVHNDIRLFLIDNFLKIQKIILENSIKLIEKQNEDATIPGFTHYRQAMPIKWSSYIDMILSFNNYAVGMIDDFMNLINYPAYGYGSGFGSLSKFDNVKLCRLLGLNQGNLNPLFQANLRGFDELNSIHLLSSIILFYSRIATDLILWSTENGFVEIPSDYITGSSLMPNKKNPDFLEMLIGFAAEFVSHEHLIQNLLLGKGSFYHREFQIAKWKVMDSVSKFEDIAQYFFDLLSKVKINHGAAERIIDNSIYATQNSALLVYNGIPWKESYEIIGKKILTGEKLEEIEPGNFKIIDKDALNKKLNSVIEKIERREKLYAFLLGAQ